MKTILVYGAGVLGSQYAGRLSQAGCDVTLLARGERLRELRERGLLLAENRSAPNVLFLVNNADGRRSARLEWIADALGRAGFPVAICPNMDAWLKTHAMVVSPVANAIYMAGGSNCRPGCCLSGLFESGGDRCLNRLAASPKLC